MKYERWYDKNIELKEVFEFIQGLNEELQAKIAQDVLQVLMGDFNLDLDDKINEISRNYNYECKRWYDNDINLFTVFELIKRFSISEQQKIIKKIVESILLIYLESGELRINGVNKA